VNVAAIGPGFSFVVRTPKGMTLTYKQGGMKQNPANPVNPVILSPELFDHVPR